MLRSFSRSKVDLTSSLKGSAGSAATTTKRSRLPRDRRPRLRSRSSDLFGVGHGRREESSWYCNPSGAAESCSQLHTSCASLSSTNRKPEERKIASVSGLACTKLKGKWSRLKTEAAQSSSSSYTGALDSAGRPRPRARASGRVHGQALEAGEEPTPTPTPTRLESEASVQPGLSHWFTSFVGFTRPHTMFGTAVSVSSVSLLALRSLSDLNVVFATGVLTALVSALAMNVSIVGLNQLYDIEIDKVNKPYLPLASGAFSIRTGQLIVIASALISLAIGNSNCRTRQLATSILSLSFSLSLSFLLSFFLSARLPVYYSKYFTRSLIDN